MTGGKAGWDSEDEEGLPRVVMGGGCRLSWGATTVRGGLRQLQTSKLIPETFPSLPARGTQPLGGGFGVSACLLTLSAPAGRSTVAHGGAAAPGHGHGHGQEPCSLLLLHGRAGADPARAERAQDQPVPGAGGVGLLPAVSPAAVGQQPGSLLPLQPPVAHQRLLLVQSGRISLPSSW